MESRVTKTGKVVITMTNAEKELLFDALKSVIDDITKSKVYLPDNDINSLLPLCETKEILEGLKFSNKYKSVLD